LTAYLINSTIVVVLPVPGGPCTTEISFHYMQSITAYFCTLFNLSDTQSMLNYSGSLSLSLAGSISPHKIIFNQLCASSYKFFGNV